MHHCHIIPNAVLERLASDARLPEEICRNAEYSAQLSQHLRDIRHQSENLTGFMQQTQSLTVLAKNPEITLFDCKQTFSLPGTQVKRQHLRGDATAARTYAETRRVANFLRKFFNRNSIDNAGMTMVSSVHYGKKYNNAMWNGMQMVYGDGDGELFLDFNLGCDVIGHELTHGLTQYTLKLDYDDEPGGLNESLSDCFGSMFRQWRLGQDAASADWLIGNDILGPKTLSQKFNCLRDMAHPAGKHCLSPQPEHYTKLKPEMDPHQMSGPPNLAFCTACKQVGGYSWQTIGQVWYQVMQSAGLCPRMTMADFCDRSKQAARSLFGQGSAVEAAVTTGWQTVGL